MNRDMLKIKKNSKHCLQRTIRLLINLSLLSGFISLTGCAGIHLYNPDKDAIASLVKKTSDGISFKAVIEEERKNQTKLLTYELEVVAQNYESIRNEKLLYLLGDGEKSLSRKLDESINERLSAIEEDSNQFKIAKNEAEKDLNKQKDAAKKANEKYLEALNEYNNALKQAKTDASDAAKKEIADRAKDLLDALNDFEKSGIFGKQNAAKSQIENIDLILDALVTGEVAEGKLNCSDIKDEKAQKKCLDKQQALTVVSQLPRFRGRFSAIEALSKQLPVNALLFEKERLMALKENADIQIERSNARIKLLEQKLKSAKDDCIPSAQVGQNSLIA